MQCRYLYLASQSSTRARLLREAGYAFDVLKQSADESACDWQQECDVVALSIARSKMQHVVMPAVKKSTEIFIITADTVVQDHAGLLYAKPESFDDALAMLKHLSSGVITVSTGFCITRYSAESAEWFMRGTHEEVVSGTVVLKMTDACCREYLAHTPDFLHIAGALALEGYSAQFVESIAGSYTGILGLPMSQVRQALTTLGFFK